MREGREALYLGNLPVLADNTVRPAAGPGQGQLRQQVPALPGEAAGSQAQPRHQRRASSLHLGVEAVEVDVPDRLPGVGGLEATLVPEAEEGVLEGGGVGQEPRLAAVARHVAEEGVCLLQGPPAARPLAEQLQPVVAVLVPLLHLAAGRPGSLFSSRDDVHLHLQISWLPLVFIWLIIVLPLPPLLGTGHGLVHKVWEGVGLNRVGGVI